MTEPNAVRMEGQEVKIYGLTGWQFFVMKEYGQGHRDLPLPHVMDELLVHANSPSKYWN